MIARTRKTAFAPLAGKVGAAPSVRTVGLASPPSPGVTPQGADSVSNIGFWFLLVFVFLSSSRILDFAFNNLHLPLILSLLAAAFTFISGGFQATFSTRIGKLMALFTVWLMVCTAFSEWRGGSFVMLRDIWSKSFLVFIIVAGATKTTIQARRMMVAIGLGTAGAMALAHLLHGNVNGRLSLPVGYLGNPNDLGQVMLVGLCFLSVVLKGGKSLFARLFVLVVSLVFVYSIFETGSRGALLGMMAIGGLIFIYASPGRKVMLLIAFAVLGTGMFAVSPVARVRMATLFSSDDADTRDSSQEMAVASTENRTLLLRESLQLTLRNPLFGVGPGTFESSAAALSHEQGGRALWKETHNSYTQVSSETGIPGALFFLGAIGSSIAGLIRVRRKAGGLPEYRMIHAVTGHLLVGFLAFVLTSFFSSVAYQFYFCLLIGLCAATISAAERELGAALSPNPQLSKRRVETTPGQRPAWDPVTKRLRA